MKPTRRSFPQRNRIVAGISQCVFVPEAGEESGSLITVDEAVAHGKPVFGVPQSVFAVNSKGLLRCMQEGTVHVVADIGGWVQEFWGPHKGQATESVKGMDDTDLSGDQRTVVTALCERGEPMHIDELVSVTGLGVTELMAALSMLEIG